MAQIARFAFTDYSRKTKYSTHDLTACVCKCMYVCRYMYVYNCTCACVYVWCSYITVYITKTIYNWALHF